MTTQTEALKLALEALETYKNFIDDAHILEGQWHWIDGLDNVQAAIKEALAQPEQKPVSWKLVPVQPTEEMLKAMDECSTEGYDERLYAGHAASVYMAAVDAAPASPQQCYCGDITRLGVVHRADSFCDEKPEQELCEYCKRGLKTMCLCGIATKVIHQFRSLYCADWYDGVPDHHDGHGPYETRTLYTTPPQRKPLTDEQRFDLLTKFEPHKNKWEAPAILIDMVEATHNIKE